MKRLGKLIRDERGASMVEAGFAMPIVMAMTLGLIYFSFAIWDGIALSRATFQAARCAAINSTTCGSSNAIAQYAVNQGWGVNFSTTDFSTSTPCSITNVTGSADYPLPATSSLRGSYTFPLTNLFYFSYNTSLGTSACYYRQY